MEERLRKLLREKVQKGAIVIPEGWDFGNLVAYYDFVPEHVWVDAIAPPRGAIVGGGTPRRMAKNTKLYKRLDKTLTRIEKMKKKALAKRRKALEKREQFYGMNPTLFGKGTVNLVSKNDLTLGMAAKTLDQIKQTTIMRLLDVQRKAKEKNMLKPFDEAVDLALKMAKNQGAKGIYFALNEVANAFERQLKSMASKRTGPRSDGMPAARPTVSDDEEDEDEKSPKAEED